MGIGARAELNELSAGAEGFNGQGDVSALVSGLDKGIQGSQERYSDGLELRVGIGEGGFEGINVGEEGTEVVDGHDEVLIVGPADVLDFGLFGSGEVTEVVVEGLGFAGGEGLADEGTQVFAVADGNGEEELVLLVRRIPIFISRRNYFPAQLGGVHDDDVGGEAVTAESDGGVRNGWDLGRNLDFGV